MADQTASPAVTVPAAAAMTNTIAMTITALIGGLPYSATMQGTLAPAPQVLSSIAIVAGVI